MLYEDLTPSTDETIDKNGFYRDSIEWALKNDNITNIALTGVYGSGKMIWPIVIETGDSGLVFKYVENGLGIAAVPILLFYKSHLLKIVIRLLEPAQAVMLG